MWTMNIFRHLFGPSRKELDARIKDIEKHFVTKRAGDGTPIETLADVPLVERKARKLSMKGMSWPQRRVVLEQTDGGRRA